MNMHGSVSIDLTVSVSEEAKICLNCDKQKCSPNGCERYKRLMKEIKAKTTRKLKTREEK